NYAAADEALAPLRLRDPREVRAQGFEHGAPRAGRKLQAARGNSHAMRFIEKHRLAMLIQRPFVGWCPGLRRAGCARARGSTTAATLPAALPGHDLLPAIGQPAHGLPTNAGVAEVASLVAAHRWQGDHAGRCSRTPLTSGFFLQYRTLHSLTEPDHSGMRMAAVFLAVERCRVAGHGVVRLPRRLWRRLVLGAGLMRANGLRLDAGRNQRNRNHQQSRQRVAATHGSPLDSRSSVTPHQTWPRVARRYTAASTLRETLHPAAKGRSAADMKCSASHA